MSSELDSWGWFTPTVQPQRYSYLRFGIEEGKPVMGIYYYFNHTTDEP